MARSIITLTTDFGSADPYVGIMKGVILGIHPDVDLVDITHDIRAYDVMEAAYQISQAYRYFPPRTIHLVVVDPGVGTDRRPIIVSVDKYYLVAPDNGVLSVVFSQEETVAVRHVTSEHYFLEPVSRTFHGRDVFAPIAAWLARGVESAKFGETITDHVRYQPPVPKRVNEHLQKGIVVRVDRFGSLMTNLTPRDVPEIFGGDPRPFKIVIGKSEITELRQVYAEGEKDEVFAILGSSGYIEIAVNRGSASRTLGVGKGTEVGVVLA